MLDLRPIGYVIGLLAAFLGATMLIPLAVDLYHGNDHWRSFGTSALIAWGTGVLLALSCANGVRARRHGACLTAGPGQANAATCLTCAPSAM